MSDNKALWKRVFVTDPKHVKPITGKQYSGNSPKPYWIVDRLTSEFGPCGIGWGFTILSERFERFSDTDTLHVAVVRMWYVLDGKRGELEQVGQTKGSYRSGAGKFIVDEDAPKKSVTDALVKCASYLGFAGDIFSGMWDDSKYVAQADREWRGRESEASKMSDEDMGTWLAFINECKTSGELKGAIKKAVAAAMEVNDSRAVDQFNAAAEAKVATARAKAKEAQQ